MDEMRYLPPNPRFKRGSGNWLVWEWLATWGMIETKVVHALGCDMSRVADCKKAMAQYGFTLPKGGIKIGEGNYLFKMIRMEDES